MLAFADKAKYLPQSILFAVYTPGPKTTFVKQNFRDFIAFCRWLLDCPAAVPGVTGASPMPKTGGRPKLIQRRFCILFWSENFTKRLEC
jgi:hypothetical protein